MKREHQIRLPEWPMGLNPEASCAAAARNCPEEWNQTDAVAQVCETANTANTADNCWSHRESWTLNGSAKSSTQRLSAGLPISMCGLRTAQLAVGGEAAAAGRARQRPLGKHPAVALQLHRPPLSRAACPLTRSEQLLFGNR